MSGVLHCGRGTGYKEKQVQVSKRAVRVNPGDNVATALDYLEAGDTVRVSERDGSSFGLLLLEAVPFGHKIALQPIAAGDDVLKYGASIGEATASIPRGGYVHTHNVASRRARARSERGD